jgi:plasmid stabilization system protein ParE
MRLKDYVVVVALIAMGVVLAVGLSRAKIGRDATVYERDLAPVRDRVEKLQSSWERNQQPRLADLEARVAALEGAPIREGAPAPEAWSPADVAALRAGLEKVKVAERRDREAQQLRNVVAHIVPDAEPAVRERVVTLLQQTIEQARAEPERAGALRADLLTKLGETFPVDIAGRLAGLVPGGEPSEESR